MDKVTAELAGTFSGHSAAIYGLAASAEGRFYSASSDGYAALWNLHTMQQEDFAAKFPEIVYSVCELAESALLIAGCGSGKVHFLDLRTRRELKILHLHQGPVFSIIFSPVHNCIFSISGDGTLARTDLASLQAEKIVKLSSEKLRSIDMHDGSQKMLVAAGDGHINVVSAVDLSVMHRFEAHALSANIARYYPGKEQILSGGRDAQLCVWDAGDYKLVNKIPAHNFAIYDIAFSPDNKLFATASRDKTVKIWDPGSMQVLKRISLENGKGHKNSVNRLLWMNEPELLLSAGDDRRILAWKINQP